MSKAPRKPRLAWPQTGLEPAEVSAVKAMISAHPGGYEALQKLCLRGRSSFELGTGRVDGARMTDFNEGRRYVGNTLEWIREVRLATPGRGAPPADLPNSPTPAPKSASDDKGSS